MDVDITVQLPIICSEWSEIRSFITIAFHFAVNCVRNVKVEKEM
jgi:hypothetical protein